MTLAFLSFFITFLCSLFILNCFWDISLSRTLILGLALGMVLGSLVCTVLTQCLRHAKHHKPPYLYLQQLRLMAERLRLVKPRICVRSGVWSI